MNQHQFQPLSLLDTVISFQSLVVIRSRAILDMWTMQRATMHRNQPPMLLMVSLLLSIELCSHGTCLIQPYQPPRVPTWQQQIHMCRYMMNVLRILMFSQWCLMLTMTMTPVSIQMQGLPLSVLNMWMVPKPSSWQLNALVMLLSLGMLEKYTNMNCKSCVKLSLSNQLWPQRLCSLLQLTNQHQHQLELQRKSQLLLQLWNHRRYQLSMPVITFLLHVERSLEELLLIMSPISQPQKPQFMFMDSMFPLRLQTRQSMPVLVIMKQTLIHM